MSACNKDDQCGIIICNKGKLNPETCKCDCPDGFSGENCQIDDNIQSLLKAGRTPFSLFKEGISLDRLYGQSYLGGLIFYLDTISGKGMVASPEDLSKSAIWGCASIDLPGAKNCITFPPPIPDIEVGARIGDGKVNTYAILTECLPITNISISDTEAAKLCRAKGENWFLPSRDELNLMYINLKKNGHGKFEENWYWSSSEFNNFNAWMQDFKGGFQIGHGKFWDLRVRAVCEF